MELANKLVGYGNGFWERTRPLRDAAVSFLCVFDFLSDVGSAQAFAHSANVPKVRYLGYAAAACLVIAAFINFIVVMHHKMRFSLLYGTIKATHPCLDQVFVFLTLTNAEVLSAQLALTKAGLPADLKLKASVAESDLKGVALVSQIIEDIPQFSLSVAASVLTLMNHGQVPQITTLSLCVSFFMLFFKALGNMVVSAVSLDAPAPLLQQVAKQEDRSMAPLWSIFSAADACGFGMQLLVTLGAVALGVLLHDWQQPLPVLADRLQPLLGLSQSSIAILFIVFLFYCIALIVVLGFIRDHRQNMWHLQLQLSQSVAVIAAATVHPATLNAVRIAGGPAVVAIGDEELIWQFLLILCPLARSFLLGAFGLWLIWKDDPPVAEKLLILFVMLCGSSSFQMVASWLTSGHRSTYDALSQGQPDAEKPFGPGQQGLTLFQIKQRGEECSQKMQVLTGTMHSIQLELDNVKQERVELLQKAVKEAEIYAEIDTNAMQFAKEFLDDLNLVETRVRRMKVALQAAEHDEYDWHKCQDLKEALQALDPFIKYDEGNIIQGARAKYERLLKNILFDRPGITYEVVDVPDTSPAGVY